jgi:hypothetical protein
MFLPPGPISAPILSTGILTVMMRGAWSFISGRGGMTSSILPRMARRACALFEGFFHDIGAQAADFDVHLQGGDARFGAGDFEIHIAEVVFGALDVGQDLVAARSLIGDEAHGHTATGALIGTPASINARVEPQTDAIEVEPLEDSTSETRRRV